LLIFSSRRKVALQHSDVTEELMLYLARISDALEIQSSRTPERVLAEMAAAIKQQNNLAPPPSLDSEPKSVRVPRFNVEMPPER
jgi:hypothetical protein